MCLILMRYGLLLRWKDFAVIHKNGSNVLSYTNLLLVVRRGVC